MTERHNTSLSKQTISQRGIPEQHHESFKSDVLRLASGNTIAQLVVLLTAPIITRLFTPEVYGGTALFTSLTGIVGVIVCMRYELAIVLPDNDAQAANLVRGSLLIASFISFVIFIALDFSGEYLAQSLGVPLIAEYLWLVPIVVFLNSLFDIFNYWNIRLKRFGILSFARVINQSLGAGAKITAGLFGFQTMGALILSGLGGLAVATYFILQRSLRESRKHLFEKFTWSEMFDVLKQYKKFPIYSSWSSLLNKLSWKLPILMLAFYFSKDVVGYYVLGFAMLQMPMSVIGGAISQVFLQRAARARIEGELHSLVYPLFQLLVSFSLLPMLILLTIGADLFSVVFGEEWREAGIYAQVLSPWAFIWFISSPFGNLCNVLGKQQFNLKINMCLFFTRLLSIVFGGLANNPLLALSLLSITGVLVYGFFLHRIIRMSEINLHHCLLRLAVEFNKALIYLMPILIAKIFVEISSLILVIIAFFVMAVFSYKNHYRQLIEERFV
jgi:lipopolysaccharide exporter